MSLRERVNAIESSAISHLLEKFAVNKHRLLSEYRSIDVENTGFIGLTDWCKITGSVLELNLPWRTLHKKLVKLNDNGDVFYHSAFIDSKIDSNLRRLVIVNDMLIYLNSSYQFSKHFLFYRMLMRMWLKRCIDIRTHWRAYLGPLIKIIQVIYN